MGICTLYIRIYAKLAMYQKSLLYTGHAPNLLCSDPALIQHVVYNSAFKAYC